MLVISWPVPSKSVAARAEKRETDTCAAWFLPIHMKHFFNRLMIYIFTVSTWSFFWFGIRIYPYHITRLDPYFLHLAGAHFVLLACAHCYCPGGRSKLYPLILCREFLALSANAKKWWGSKLVPSSLARRFICSFRVEGAYCAYPFHKPILQQWVRVWSQTSPKTLWISDPQNNPSSSHRRATGGGYLCNHPSEKAWVNSSPEMLCMGPPEPIRMITAPWKSVASSKLFKITTCWFSSLGSKAFSGYYHQKVSTETVCHFTLTDTGATGCTDDRRSRCKHSGHSNQASDSTSASAPASRSSRNIVLWNGCPKFWWMLLSFWWSSAGVNLSDSPGSESPAGTTLSWESP